MLIVGGNQSAGGYEVANSLRFENTSTDGLTRTISSSGNRKTWTWSGWVKRSKLTNTTSDPQILFNSGENTAGILDFNVLRFNTDDKFAIIGVSNNGATTNYSITTNAVYRDVSAWYHVVVAFDSTQGTSSDRIKLYINGEQVTSFSSTTYPSLNYDSFVNFVTRPYYGIGDRINTSGQLFAGYMSEVVLIDGQALDPTSFGEFDEDTGIWKPIDVSGLTFGTNGFYLDFEDSGSLGADVSGNGNNFTVNNLTSIDQTTDTPTNNYATMNPLFVYTTNPTYSNGNCTTSSPTTGGTRPISTIEVPKTGKWYCEIKVDSTTGTIGDNSRIGIYVPSNATYNARYLSNGNYNLDASASSYGATFGAGDIIGIAVDSDSNTIEFYKNGVSQGSLSYTMQSNETYFFTAFESSNTIGINYSYNFGNPPFSISSGNSDGNGYGNFEYSVPSGYYALNTKNLAEYG